MLGIEEGRESEKPAGTAGVPGVLVGRLICFGERKPGGPYQLDLAVERDGEITHERVSGFAETEAAFAVLAGVKAGALLRVRFVLKGKYKNLSLDQAPAIEVLEEPVRPLAADYRVFGGKPSTHHAIIWLACLKAAAARLGGVDAESLARAADDLVGEYDKRFAD